MAAHTERLFEFLNEHLEVKASIEILGDPNVTSMEQAIARLEEQKNAIDSYLRQLPPEDLKQVARQAMTEADAHRPFNGFGTEADFEHYGRCTYLTSHEAVALSLGKNPRVVTEEAVQPFYGISAFADTYSNRLDLLDRAVAWGELPPRFTPLQFLTWAHERKIDVPDEFIRCAFVRGEPIRYWHNLCLELARDLEAATAQLDKLHSALDDERDRRIQQTFEDWAAANELMETLRRDHESETASLRDELAKAQQKTQAIEDRASCLSPTDQSSDLRALERKSLLTIIIVTAVHGLGYAPNASKSPIPKEIADAAVRMSLSLTDDTARKYLKEAAQLKGLTLSQ